jgi:hypothetical protein
MLTIALLRLHDGVAQRDRHSTRHRPHTFGEYNEQNDETCVKHAFPTCAQQNMVHVRRKVCALRSWQLKLSMALLHTAYLEHGWERCHPIEDRPEQYHNSLLLTQRIRAAFPHRGWRFSKDCMHSVVRAMQPTHIYVARDARSYTQAITKSYTVKHMNLSLARIPTFMLMHYSALVRAGCELHSRECFECRIVQRCAPLSPRLWSCG